MLEILKTIAGAVVTGGASTAGGLAARVAAFAALIASLTGPGLWFWNHRGEEFVSFTVGQVTSGAAIGGVFLYLVVLLAHRAPPP